MSDPDRTALAQRIESIRATAGLPAFADTAAVVDALHASGCSIHFHHILADSQVEDRLRVLHSRTPHLYADVAALTGPGPKNPAFAAFVGKLDFDKLPPARKLSLWNEFQAQQSNPPKSTADRLHAELTARYGSPEAADANMTSLERARVADLTGTKAQPIQPMPQTAATRAASPQRRLAMASAHTERVTLSRRLASLESSRGETPNLRSYRDSEATRIRDRLDGIRRQFPELGEVA